ncbi:MAG: glycosyltransferase family 4 protein [Candidatus Hydrogenedens sp.]|nr:glycosyltransferase family 4 protein [Candidatus Hydrogenedens sp.]
MRIAFVDLLFSWPPHGGADVDVYHVLQELKKLGYEIHLFTVREEGSWERGDIQGEDPPFPVSLLEFREQGLSEKALSRRMAAAVKDFGQDIVFLMQGYFLKVILSEALSEYPLLSRCYAHETHCHKDILRFRDGAPCPCSYVDTPEICRNCALAYQRSGLSSGIMNAWTREYVESRAWTQEYYQRFLRSLKTYEEVIVTTSYMRDEMEHLTKKVTVIPHAVDVQRFTPPEEKTVNTVPVLFVPGRIEDPAKGLPLFLEAAEKLAQAGYSFEVRATLPEGYEGPPWLKAVGKLDYASMPEAYRGADLCVVPSLWEEPFGLVALEAMASGVAVCASRTGGLQDIVVHGKTGFLFERGNGKALAACLEKLLDDHELRTEMGVAGRQRAVEVYDWRKMVAEYYPKLFERVCGDR